MARAPLLCVAFGSALAAQAALPPLRGNLIGPSGEPVAEAEVEFVADQRPELPALAGLLAPPPGRSARSDPRGRFAIDGLAGPGTLLATTAAGLGAFAARCRPGDPLLLQLQPMAELGAAGRSEPFRLWAAWLESDGSRRFLPPRQGRAVRLPAGSYEVWYQLGEGFHWTRLELLAGRPLDLPFGPAVRRLQRGGRIQAHPSGWPQVELFPGDSLFCSLFGDAGLATLTTRVLSTGQVIAGRQVQHSHDLVPQVWPPEDLQGGQARSLRVSCAGEPAVAATAWLLRQLPREDRWQPLATAQTDQQGRLQLACPQPADGCWLLVTAEACAPFGASWDTLESGATIALEPARALAVRCTAAAAVDDVCLEFEPRGAAVAKQRCRTDVLGRARFAVGKGSGRLLVSDPRFANAEIAVAPAEDPVRLELAPGAVLGGLAVLADDRPAAGAVVTLRDPRGLLRPAERSVVARLDGSFSFAGLPPEADFVLFAQQRRDGRTWSGKLAPARADGNRYLVELRCEDPELPRGDGR